MDANKLAECLRPVADFSDSRQVKLGPANLLVWGMSGEKVSWHVQSKGGDMTAEHAADLAAMHLIRRLNAAGWYVEIAPIRGVKFHHQYDSKALFQQYDHHPIEALASFASTHKIGAEG